MALKIKGGKVKSLKALKSSLKKGGGGAHYMKRVPSDDSITVRFLTEPEDWVEYLEYFSEDDGFFPAVEGMDEAYVADLNSPSKRWLAAAVDTADNSVINLVLPKSLVSNLLKKYEKYKTLMDRDYELSREGSGFDTEYDAIPESPTKMNLSRFDIPDLMETLEAAVPEALGGGDIDDDDDYDDDDNLAAEDDDDRPMRSRRPARKPPVKKKPSSGLAAKKKPIPKKKPTSGLKRRR